MRTESLQKLGNRALSIFGFHRAKANGALRVPPAEVARQLYREIVAQARCPRFYEAYDVPDTPDGRFDMIALHAALVMRRLRTEATIPPAVGQALFDQMFAEFDESLREMGVGDLRVGKVVKAMAKGFYGRLANYGRCLDAADRLALQEALRRNVYRHVEPDARAVAALAGYVFAEEARLAARSADQILTDGLMFQSPAPM